MMSSANAPPHVMSDTLTSCHTATNKKTTMLDAIWRLRDRMNQDRATATGGSKEGGDSSHTG
jgi:hypothetical protein